MRIRHALAASVCAVVLALNPAWAQDKPPEKPTFSNYLLQGYDIIHTEGGGGTFLFFILRKERSVVWCSVLLQSGETSSCRTLK